MLKLSLKNLLQTIDFPKYQDKVTAVHNLINAKNGPGSDFLGWTTWPEKFDKVEFGRILEAGKFIRANFDVLVVCGIGGSYLGARAAIEALRGLYSSDKIEIIYFGHTFSPTYTYQVLEYLKNKRFAVNVISKSGTTTETSIAFRLLKALLEKKLTKEEAKKAIFATTDKEKGALKTLAKAEGYETFTLPDDIGGRYSVLTAVGLLPMAAAGIDISALMEGAKEAMVLYDNISLEKNICYQYAVSRNMLYGKKAVELYVTYEPHFSSLSEWLKQLFGESEGKEDKGLFPGSVSFSTDLHSLGQFIQEGSPIIFETVIYVNKPKYDVNVPLFSNDLDGLNYLAGRPLSYINDKACLGTMEAHINEGQVPVISFTLDEMNAKNLGHLFYFFMKACAMSAYLLNINPFNQPGVEVYKRNMFRLLGKKGY